MDDQIMLQLLQNNQFGSDRQYLYQIMNSIDKHDPKVMSKIQKRRGRKKFILNNDDFNSSDSIYATVLNKREQKYLSKVVQMAEHPLSSLDAKRS